MQQCNLQVGEGGEGRGEGQKEERRDERGKKGLKRGGRAQAERVKERGEGTSGEWEDKGEGRCARRKVGKATGYIPGVFGCGLLWISCPPSHIIVSDMPYVLNRYPYATRADINISTYTMTSDVH